MTHSSRRSPGSYASSVRYALHPLGETMPKLPEPAGRLEGSRWTPYLFVAPVAVYLLVFQGYPLLQELLLGFTSTSLLSPADHTYVGLRNYVELIGTSDFHGALLITANYT